MAPKRSIQNVWGSLLQQFGFGHFDAPYFYELDFFSIIVLAGSCSTRITLGKLLNGHEIDGTQQSIQFLIVF